jgi:hypothetical protein
VTLIEVRGQKDQEFPILPAPVRIFVDEALRLIRDGRSFDDLPHSLPEAYFRYLEQVNPKTPGARNRMKDEAMLEVAKLLGRLAVESDFVPKEFSKDSARDRLRAAGWTDTDELDPIQRLLDSGVLTEKKTGGYYALRFELDPIAEFLAAAAWAKECGSNAGLWADLKRKSAAASGFQIALSLTLQTYTPKLDWDKL